jgi:hypothetical protein
MAEKYVVELTGEERSELERPIRGGTSDARALRNARVLLKADGGRRADRRGARRLGPHRRPRSSRRAWRTPSGPRGPRPLRKLDDEVQARLVALCCGETPAGHARRTLRLPAEKAV